MRDAANRQVKIESERDTGRCAGQLGVPVRVCNYEHRHRHRHRRGGDVEMALAIERDMTV